MYHDIRKVYCWDRMKKDIAEFVAKRPNCQQVKIEHPKPDRLLQAIDIPTCKWEAINMDFIIGLPRSQRKFDSIWMAPYKALYGWKCRSPIRWFEVGKSKLIGPYLIQQAVEKVKLIQERLLVAQIDYETWSFR
ncbi:uncharacterized protein LOC132628381 [Lycium barbarum]|uniref:uncharacterized protein LOC132628381 n=1 Tax=Lycium barbarum TaxID=112863 RepID=UPI00293E48DA|nr:uncharacterized protein LOC132628381 [Lycium barbarum]